MEKSARSQTSYLVRLGLASTALTLLIGACNTAQPSAAEGVTTTSSALAIPQLFPTGVNDLGAVLAPGTVDPHYILSSNDPLFPGPNAVAVKPNATWVGNTPTASWISIQTSTAGATGDTYTYTTTFTLTGVDPTSATLSGTWAADDSVTLLLNNTQVAHRAANAYASSTAFTVPAGSPFQEGTNTLAFVTLNSGGGPTGLQVATLAGTVNGCTLDAQCTSAQFCDTQASACTAKLANGANIPTITGHTPALTGVCSSAAVGTSVCVSGVCDATNNECGYADGDGPCTVLDGPTVCQSGVCSTMLVCEPVGGCETDDDCTGGKWCDEATSTCTPTLANGSHIPTDSKHTNPTLNGDCSPQAGALVCTSGVCDTKDNECGYANGDGPCTALDGSTVCRSGACGLSLVCVPVGGCVDDADCTGGKWCDEATSTCTDKLSNGQPVPDDPQHSNPTLNGVCNSGAGALVCASGVCDTKDNDCGYANGDGPCSALDAATVCRSGACSIDLVCEPAGGCETDADCTGGKWCDEASSTCTAKLANGTAIPTDPMHVNPTLQGKCTTQAALLVCLSGVCDTDNECGFANEDGPCTSGAGAAVCRSGACSVNLTCEPVGGCNVDGDCTVSTPDCNVTTHTCTASPDGGGIVDSGFSGDGGSEGGDAGDAGDAGDSGSSVDGSVAPDAAPTVDSGQEDASNDAYLGGGGVSCTVTSTGNGEASVAGLFAALAMLVLNRRKRRTGEDAKPPQR